MSERETLKAIAQLTNVGRGDIISLQDALHDIHNLATAALTDKGTAPAQCDVDLTDPVVVHANMLRGTIAKLTWAQIQHLYLEEFAAERAQRSDVQSGHDEASGFAASLRQQAQWIEESREAKVSVYLRITLDDIDTDEMRAAAEFIENNIPSASPVASADRGRE